MTDATLPDEVLPDQLLPDQLLPDGVLPAAAPGARRLPVLPRAAGFWLTFAILLVFLAGAAAPSPLYVVYQQRFGFSPATLTVVFAVYAVALLVSLLVVGSLSDHVGRRPVLAVALVVDAAAMVVFWTAGGVGALLVARVVQGIATGAAIGVLSAYLIDLAPPHRATLGALLNSIGASFGLAVGAVAAGAVVQATPSPDAPVFGTLTVLLLASALLLAVMPEAMTRRPGALASLRPRVGLPAAARAPFLRVLPVFAADWAMGGLYLSLAPSLLAGVLHQTNHLAGGFLIATLMAFGAAGSLAANGRRATPVMVTGALLLALGTALTVVALHAGSVTGVFTASAVSGIGFGASFSGSLGSLVAYAPAQQRAELFATVFVACYTAFSVPAVLAGLAARPYGLLPTATVFGLVVVLSALAAAGLGVIESRRGYH